MKAEKSPTQRLAGKSRARDHVCVACNVRSYLAPVINVISIFLRCKNSACCKEFENFMQDEHLQRGALRHLGNSINPSMFHHVSLPP